MLLPTGDVGDWSKCNNHIQAPTALRELIWWIMPICNTQSLTASQFEILSFLDYLCLVLVFDFHIFDIQISRRFGGIQKEYKFSFLGEAFVTAAGLKIIFGNQYCWRCHWI